MRLWTYQPRGFQIDAPGLTIDPAQGPYWNQPGTPLYKEALAKLRKMLGIEQWPLWCCTVPGVWLPIDSFPVDEWELNVPDSQVVAFIRELPWHAIMKGTGEDWEKVIVTERPIQPDKFI